VHSKRILVDIDGDWTWRRSDELRTGMARTVFYTFDVTNKE